ncbi:Na+/H+ antiporter [Streptomyces sp. NPDC088354]|uniref:Na+/H+ antiporter n=1 Tax=Streptomyces sp. NPDC088354 TaxID=3365856 RepID=UPI0038089ACF
MLRTSWAEVASVRGLEIVVVVLTAVLVLTWVARRLRLSEPLLLVAGGCAIGFVPALGSVELPSDVVLLLFLPALLYWESLSTSLREIRTNIRTIFMLSTVLVLATAAAVASVGNALGLSWAMALVLGAVVAPTDATAVAAVAKGLPRRTVTILRAESLVNDGTALALFAVAVGIATGAHPFGWGSALLRFAVGYVGGVAVGLAVAALVVVVRGRVRDRQVETALSLLTPFAAYLPAEALNLSGVLAVVACGLVLSQAGPRLIPAGTRIRTEAFWETTTFVLNGALFVLVGMQVPGAVRGIASVRPVEALLGALATGGVVMATRLVWTYTVPYLIRLIDRRAVQRTLRMGARERMPHAWGGMRGAVSLAAALAVPMTAVDGSPLRGRDAVVFATVVVIIVTLLVQGQTLPHVIRWARLAPDTSVADEELLARREMTDAALHALEGATDRPSAHAEVAESLRQELLAQRDALCDDSVGRSSPRAVLRADRELRRLVVGVKRTTVVRLRDSGRIDDIVLRRVQAALDAEEMRLDIAEAASTREP